MRPFSIRLFMFFFLGCLNLWQGALAFGNTPVRCDSAFSDKALQAEVTQLITQRSQTRDPILRSQLDRAIEQKLPDPEKVLKIAKQNKESKLQQVEESSFNRDLESSSLKLNKLELVLNKSEILSEKMDLPPLDILAKEVDRETLYFGKDWSVSRRSYKRLGIQLNECFLVLPERVIKIPNVYSSVVAKNHLGVSDNGKWIVVINDKGVYRWEVEQVNTDAIAFRSAHEFFKRPINSYRLDRVFVSNDGGTIVASSINYETSLIRWNSHGFSELELKNMNVGYRYFTFSEQGDQIWFSHKGFSLSTSHADLYVTRVDLSSPFVDKSTVSINNFGPFQSESGNISLDSPSPNFKSRAIFTTHPSRIQFLSEQDQVISIYKSSEPKSSKIAHLWSEDSRYFISALEESGNITKLLILDTLTFDVLTHDFLGSSLHTLSLTGGRKGEIVLLDKQKGNLVRLPFSF